MFTLSQMIPGPYMESTPEYKELLKCPGVPPRKDDVVVLKKVRYIVLHTVWNLDEGVITAIVKEIPDYSREFDGWND